MEQKLYFSFIKFQHSITPIFHLSNPSIENQFKLYNELNFIPAGVAEENKQRYILFSDAGVSTYGMLKID
jgi:hypothetical protein